MGNLNTARRALCVLGLVALPMAGAQATEAANGTLGGCRTLHDDAMRLACYDRLPDPATTPSPVARAAAKPAAAATPGATPLVAAAPVGAATVAPTPALAAPANATAEQRFGISELQQARAEAAKAEQPEALKELRAKVDKVQHPGNGGLRLTLANGQVWFQVAPSEKIEVAVGDDIVIKPAAFGSFLLVDHDRHSARVHRAQ
jgi:hypothetical protein